MVIEDIKIFFNLATVVEEVYLIKNDEILLSYHTRRIKPMIDQDILAGHAHRRNRICERCFQILIGIGRNQIQRDEHTNCGKIHAKFHWGATHFQVNLFIFSLKCDIFKLFLSIIVHYSNFISYKKDKSPLCDKAQITY